MKSFKVTDKYKLVDVINHSEVTRETLNFSEKQFEDLINKSLFNMNDGIVSINNKKVFALGRHLDNSKAPKLQSV